MSTPLPSERSRAVAFASRLESVLIRWTSRKRRPIAPTRVPWRVTAGTVAASLTPLRGTTEAFRE